jgi:hypothetical protein
MKRRIRFLFLLGMAMLLLFVSVAAGAEQPQGLIQMAILLDTSNSMDGLIDQAKSQIWKVVNELALAKKLGKSPRLEVALYEYGKSTIPENQGYLRMVLGLTADLDSVSQELFALKTEGGDEYCGQVIQSAVSGMRWNNSNNDYKLIIIAGNEPFTQGMVDYRKSCKAAIAKGIVVNTIFCGDSREGIETNWKDGADLADGSYMSIDQNQKTVQISAPQDGEIVKLGQELNKTYLPYGQGGAESKTRQEKEDTNAATMCEESIVQRSVAKSSGLYVNTTWDLVDAVKKDGYKILDEIKVEELPQEMQKMTKDERKKFIEGKIKERESIQNKINQLNQERRVYVEKEMQKQANQNTLDFAIIKAIRAQAVKKNFKFAN